jgi:hypothetical protein
MRLQATGFRLQFVFTGIGLDLATKSLYEAERIRRSAALGNPNLKPVA